MLNLDGLDIPFSVFNDKVPFRKYTMGRAEKTELLNGIMKKLKAIDPNAEQNPRRYNRLPN